MKSSLPVSSAGLVFAMGSIVLADPLLNTGGQLGVSRTYSTYTMGEGSFNTGASLKADYGYESIYLKNSDGSISKQDIGLFSEDVFVGYGVTNWLDASLDLPFYQDAWKNHWNDANGIGDLSLALKAEHPGLYREAPLRVGYLLRGVFPTSTQGDGYYPRHVYTTRDTLNTSGAYGVNGFALNPEILWTLDFSKFPSRTPLQVHANLGGIMQVQTSGSMPRRQHTAVMGNLAVQYQANSNVGLFWELSGESKLENFIDHFEFFKDWNKSVLRTSLGTTFKSASGLNGSVGVDVGLTNDTYRSTWLRTNNGGGKDSYTANNTPTIGINLTLGFSQKGAHALPFLGRFFAAEDTVRVFDTLRIVQNDTVRLIKNDTVVVFKNDTIKVVTTQNPNAKIQYGVLVFRSINFESNSAELAHGSFRALDDIAQSLTTFPEVSIEVRGYTDDKGTPEANRRLSQARAQSVVDYLVKKGISSDRLRAEGAGSTDFVADNNTAEGRFLNRRVEIRRIDLPNKGK